MVSSETFRSLYIYYMQVTMEEKRRIGGRKHRNSFNLPLYIAQKDRCIKSSYSSRPDSHHTILFTAYIIIAQTLGASFRNIQNYFSSIIGIEFFIPCSFYLWAVDRPDWDSTASGP